MLDVYGNALHCACGLSGSTLLITSFLLRERYDAWMTLLYKLGFLMKPRVHVHNQSLLGDAYLDCWYLYLGMSSISHRIFCAILRMSCVEPASTEMISVQSGGPGTYIYIKAISPSLLHLPDSLLIDTVGVAVMQ